MSDTQPPSDISSLIQTTKSLFEQTFDKQQQQEEEQTNKTSQWKYHCTSAPGRVNLIGEHTDYTGGFVLPLAIKYSTVCYGRGRLTDEKKGKCRIISTSFSDVVEFDFVHPSSSEKKMEPLEEPKWANYVVGVVAEYARDLDEGMVMEFDLAIGGNVPLGSGLSSSASLEVSVARFVECVLGPEYAFRTSDSSTEKSRSTERALRCQRCENHWCDSPCGIMDQFVSSAGQAGALLLIDCRKVDYEPCFMGEASSKPALLVCNSNVSHSIAGGEYPVRVRQCQEALASLQRVHGKDRMKQLRDAHMKDLEAAKEDMDDVTYRRAWHVITENKRTVDAAEAWKAGEWERVGELMNGSHDSMRDRYEVSCQEIDILVKLAQSFHGVYGSRLTGGGFGGCTVTLVKADCVEALMEHIIKGYKHETGKDCDCFVTSPEAGSKVIPL